MPTTRPSQGAIRNRRYDLVRRRTTATETTRPQKARPQAAKNHHTAADSAGSGPANRLDLPPWRNGEVDAAGVINRAMTMRRWAALYFGVQVVRVNREFAVGASTERSSGDTTSDRVTL